MPGRCLRAAGAARRAAGAASPPRGSGDSRCRAARACTAGGAAMSARQAALYARVSTERQAEAQTVASQLAALRERAAADGNRVDPAQEFVDDGYSGTSLVRPALEQMRDLVALGGVDTLYV